MSHTVTNTQESFHISVVGAIRCVFINWGLFSVLSIINIGAIIVPKTDGASATVIVNIKKRRNKLWHQEQVQLPLLNLQEEN